MSKVIRGSLIFIHSLKYFFLIWRRLICVFSDLLDCWWNFVYVGFLWIFCDQKFSPKISTFSAYETASSLQLQPMQQGAPPGLCIHLLNLRYFIEWRRNVKTCKFWFRVRRRGGRWTRIVFLYYFMKWNRLSFLQIWLFSYFPCLLIYNVLFTMLYFIWCMLGQKVQSC